MKLINRCVLVIRPRQPYLDWAKGVGDGDVERTLPYVVADTTAYLAPDVDAPNDIERFLRRYHKQIFERELEGWWTDDADWPTPRDLKQFKEWFEVEVHTVVADLPDEPLLREEFG